MEYNVISYGESITGKKRENNEDTFLLMDEEKLYFVADGMGGHQAGEVASNLIKKTVKEIYKNLLNLEPEKRLMEIVKIVNQKIFESAKEEAELKGMGSTLTMLLLEGEKYYVAHIGDSRAYVFRNNKLNQITEDHSLIQAQIKAGYLTEEQGRQSRLKHILLKSIGGKMDVSPDIRVGKINYDDLFLLSTDGFHGELEEEEIKNLLLLPESLNDKVKNMVNFANEKDGSDNITVVLVKILKKEKK